MTFLFLSNTYRNFTDSSLSKPFLSGYDGALYCLLQAINYSLWGSLLTPGMGPEQILTGEHEGFVLSRHLGFFSQ